MDLRYMSRGGLMLDGTGDVAGTLTSLEEMNSMIDTRVKAAINAWKLYQGIGAGLDSYEGQPVNNNTELSIQRAVTAALTRQFLPSGAVQVQTVAIGNTIEVYIYVSQQLINSFSVTLENAHSAADKQLFISGADSRCAAEHRHQSLRGSNQTWCLASRHIKYPAHARWPGRPTASRIQH